MVSIATALADAPSTASAIESGRATEILQPVTEAVRTNTDIAFITIMSPDGTRFTHTDPRQIGGHYLGTIEPALRGETFTEVYTGTLGPSIRAIAPVRDASGRVVGLVSAGITQQTLAQRWRDQWPTIAVVSVGGAGDFARRGVGDPPQAAAADPRPAPGRAAGDVRTPRRDPAFGLRGAHRARPRPRRARQRRGAAPADAAAGGGGRTSDLPEFLRTYDPGVRDEVHVTDDRVLVVNRSRVGGRRATRETRVAASEVVTIRDRTELQGALGELSSLQVLTDSLRAQAHEAANKLHTVITMVEMGRPDDAVKFATDELALSQRLVDRLSDDVGEPALVALLLGKTAQADERGIALTITEDTHLPSDDGPHAADPAGDGHGAGQSGGQRDGRLRPRRSVGGGDGQPGRRRTVDPGGRQRRGHGRRDVREVHAAGLFHEVERR